MKPAAGSGLLCSFIVVMLITLAQPVHARMYQWTDPASGRTQLSGKPPAWYRSGGDHPRVFVFERGQLIDDTGVAVEDAQRRQLRQEALIEAEQSAEAAKQKAEQSALTHSPMDSLPPELPQIPEREAAAAPDGAVGEDEALVPGMAPEQPSLTAAQIAELRALISGWEARKQNRAREVIGSGAAEAGRDGASRQTLREFLEQNPDQ